MLKGAGLTLRLSAYVHHMNPMGGVMSYTQDIAAGYREAVITAAKKRLGIVEMEAMHLRGNMWAVRPKGQLGTMGWHPYPWSVCYVNADSAKQALARAKALRHAAQK